MVAYFSYYHRTFLEAMEKSKKRAIKPNFRDDNKIVAASNMKQDC
jgi:hypothetical protein